jgi:hypothetical protein
MLRTLTLGAALVAGAAVLTPVNAAPLTAPNGLANTLAADGSLVTEVRRRGGRGGHRGHRSRGGGHFRHHFGGGHRNHFRSFGHRHHHGHRHRHWHGIPFAFGFGSYYGSCSYWRYRCARWHGWGTYSYHSCLWRHGC